MPLAQFADPWQKLPVGHVENEVGYVTFDQGVSLRGDCVR